jgi:hypothetical protein
MVTEARRVNVSAVRRDVHRPNCQQPVDAADTVLQAVYESELMRGDISPKDSHGTVVAPGHIKISTIRTECQRDGTANSIYACRTVLNKATIGKLPGCCISTENINRIFGRSCDNNVQSIGTDANATRTK